MEFRTEKSEMSKELKEKLLKAFPGKMENEQAFVIQFIMNEAQQGNKPPSKDEIDNCLQEMIKDGTFEKKGPLLILKATKPTVMPLEEMEEEQSRIFAIKTQVGKEQNSADLVNSRANKSKVSIPSILATPEL